MIFASAAAGAAGGTDAATPAADQQAAQPAARLRWRAGFAGHTLVGERFGRLRSEPRKSAALATRLHGFRQPRKDVFF